MTMALTMATSAVAQEVQNRMAEKEPLPLVEQWDKTFPKSEKVAHEKVTFVNRYGITLAADLYRPKGQNRALPALAVSGPFGAVKEQSSGRYAQRLAEEGFLTLAFDPSFTGESGGHPRNLASPDLNTEDFSAAVDYLISREDVSADKIGIVGICGFGGFAVNAAAIDTRIKATVAITMYDISRCTANGYFDEADDAAHRRQMRETLNAQRTKDIKKGEYKRTAMNPKPDADAPQFMKDYYDYYKTPRGYHPRSINSGQGWNETSSLAFLNAPILAYANEIESAVMLVHGEKAHSRYFSEDTFKHLKGENKRLLIVPNAVHCDLYDNMSVIPFAEIVEFIRQSIL
ncbi:MAG: alpha/beta hydrolase [Bacteroidaceae bacterium]